MGDVRIFYADSAVVACVKPSGLLSQSGKAGEDSMILRLQGALGGEIYPVHRLDRETGGCMVYARTKEAAAFLSKAISEGKMVKEYLAAVHGKLPERDGIMEDLLLHDQRANKTYVVTRQRSGVRKAKLSYHVLMEQDDSSLVQVRLYTGRTHQIRAQFSSRKHPLIGDGRYGGGKGSPALWSVRIRFPHPDGKRTCTVQDCPDQLGGFSAPFILWEDMM